MLKACVALKLGVPLSVTMNKRLLVVPAWMAAGRQVKRPLVELMAALVGALSRLNASVWYGRAGSVAELVTVRVTPALTVWLPTGASDGAEFCRLNFAGSERPRVPPTFTLI